MNRSLLDDLNPQQREAAATVDGPVLILAGAGSGKTRVLTYRIANLVLNHGVSPQSILAVTFTNKAANEMKSRVEQLIGGVPLSMAIGTFHSVCARLLRREISALGRRRNFTILDESQQQTAVKAVLRELGIDEKRHSPSSVLARISGAKNERISPEEYERQASVESERVAALVFPLYEERLALNNSLDFDDLLSFTVRLFKEASDVLERYQERWRYVLVDEYQDTNHVQYVLTRMLAENHRNICVVGDDDQSIYSWRGANIRNILEFEKDYPETKVIKLEQNYRSTQTILDAAHSIIRHNYNRTDKRLWTEKGPGAPVSVEEMPTDIEEANFVAREIRRLVARGDAKPSDCAVLYRTNAQSRLLERAMNSAGFRYQVVGGLKFYDRREVKDLLAYLRVIANPADDQSLLRILNVPPRGLGDKSVEALQADASNHSRRLLECLRELEGLENLTSRATTSFRAFSGLLDDLIQSGESLPLVALLEYVLERTQYRNYANPDDSLEGQDRLENIDELLRHAAQATQNSKLTPSEQLTRFLDEVTLVSDQDALVEDVSAVTLITMHAAKGLEFPVVFIVGMNDGVFPHRRAETDPSQKEEERRLCYVAITRAKERLYLVRAMTRAQWGIEPDPDSDTKSRWRMMEAYPSEFVELIPAHLTARPFGMRRTSPASEGTRYQRYAGSGGTGHWPSSEDRDPRWRQAELIRPGGHGLTGGRHRWSVEPAGPAPDAEIPDSAGVVPAYRAGVKVRHAKFGIGMVLRSDLTGGDEEVTVAFEGHGIKRLSVALAPLERVGPAPHV